MNVVNEEAHEPPTESDRMERKSIISTCLTVYHYKLMIIFKYKKTPLQMQGCSNKHFFYDQNSQQVILV